MEKRTVLLFTAMAMLFLFYTAMSLQAMPDAKSSLKAQTELLNSLDEGANTQAATN